MGHPQMAKPEERPAEESPCGTPGAVYSTRYEPISNRICLSIELPARGILNSIDRPPLTAALHNALLPVIEAFYREHWGHFAGQLVPGDPDPLPATYEELFETKS